MFSRVEGMSDKFGGISRVLMRMYNTAEHLSKQSDIIIILLLQIPTLLDNLTPLPAGIMSNSF